MGYGWDYQPGNLGTRGLVPSALIDEADGRVSEGRHAFRIDTPEPIADLVADARPFAAPRLAEGLDPDAYARAFLEPFGLDIGEAGLFTDKAGHRIPISDELFRERSGAWKIAKRGREVHMAQFAEAILDPDEIWIGVARRPNPVNPSVEELVVDRRYIRVDPVTGILIVFQIGRRWWEAITAYVPARGSVPSASLLDARWGGKLLWKRNRRPG